MRALAAFVVLQNHVRLLFLTPDATDWRTSWAKAYDLISSPGRQAVFVFFVLSGFFVGGSIFRMLHEERWSWREYLLQRLTRLWVPLLPALLLTLCWDTLGQRWLGHPYDLGILSLDHCSGNYTTAERQTPLVFLGNLAFLQSVRVPVFGSNGPLWSLTYEFWYYIAFPALVLLLCARRHAQRLGLGLLLIAIWLVAGKAIGAKFGVWLLGVAVLFLPRNPMRKPVTASGFAALAAGLFLLVLGLSVFRENLPEFVRNPYFVSIPCMALVYALLCLPSREASESSQRSRELCKQLAGFSYSLYVLHYPALVALKAYLLAHGIPSWRPGPLAFGYLAGISLLIMLYAWLVSLLAESKTDVIRRSLRRRWIGTQTVPATA
jgi:peptidoglycan/LPS O-acetylase OafA/YrhL